MIACSFGTQGIVTAFSSLTGKAQAMHCGESRVLLTALTRERRSCREWSMKAHSQLWTCSSGRAAHDSRIAASSDSAKVLVETTLRQIQLGLTTSVRRSATHENAFLSAVSSNNLAPGC